MKLERQSAVIARVCISRTTLWRWVDAGTFPKPMKIGVRAIAWDSCDIDAWIEGRKAQTTVGG